MKEIEQLLELQTHLADIAASLYGDLWINNDKFWGSVTERQMGLVTNRMIDLGYNYEPTKIEEDIAELLRSKRKKRKN